MTKYGTYLIDGDFARRRGYPSLPRASEGFNDGFELERDMPTLATSGAGVCAPYPTAKYTGPTTFTTPGVVVENYIIDANLFNETSNIHVRNCVITGKAYTDTGGVGNRGLWSSFGASAGDSLIEFSDFIPDKPTYGWSAFLGHHFKSYRNKLLNTVDGYGIQYSTSPDALSGVEIAGDYGDGWAHFSPDPNHDTTDNRTHNDWIQFFGGNGTLVHGCHARAFFDPNIGTYATNGVRPQSLAHLQFSANVGYLRNVIVRKNWFQGGYVPVNALANYKKGTAPYTYFAGSSPTLEDNIFFDNAAASLPIQLTRETATSLPRLNGGGGFVIRSGHENRRPPTVNSDGVVTALGAIVAPYLITAASPT